MCQKIDLCDPIGSVGKTIRGNASGHRQYAIKCRTCKRDVQADFLTS